MFQLAPHTGLVETLGLTPKKSIPVKNLLSLKYFYGWFMWPKYTWLDMRDAFCCQFSVFRDFAKIKKTVSTSLGLPYLALVKRSCFWLEDDRWPLLMLMRCGRPT